MQIPGGYSRFQVTATIEKAFSGFEIFSFGMVMGRKILARVFWGSLIYTQCKKGLFWYSNLNGFIFVLYHFNAFWKMLCPTVRKFGMGFLGG